MPFHFSTLSVKLEMPQPVGQQICQISHAFVPSRTHVRHFLLNTVQSVQQASHFGHHLLLCQWRALQLTLRENKCSLFLCRTSCMESEPWALAAIHPHRIARCCHHSCSVLQGRQGFPLNRTSSPSSLCD